MELGMNIRNWGPTATPEFLSGLRQGRRFVHPRCDLVQRPPWISADNRKQRLRDSDGYGGNTRAVGLRRLFGGDD